MRLELHCPSCGEDVRPTLMPPPLLYTCEGCGETMERTKLSRVKVLNRRIAGVGSVGFSAVVVGSNTLSDAGAASATLTVPGCNFESGDTCIVIAAAADSAPSGVTAGNACVEWGVGPVQGGTAAVGDIWTLGNISAGTKSIVVTWSPNPTAAAVAVLAVKKARLVSSIDGTAGAGGSSTSAASGSTSTLAAVNELAIGAIISHASKNSAPIAWTNAFLPIARVGTTAGEPPNFICLDIGTKPLSTTAASSVTATLPSSVDWAALDITVRPA